MLKGCLPVYRREMLILKHRFKRQLSGQAVSPLLYIVTFGYAMGGELRFDGISYLDFLVPGLIAMASMTQAFAISTDINVARFYWHIFDEFQAAPIDNSGYVAGEVMAGISRAMIISSVVSVLIHFSRPEMVQAYMAWTFGSFANITWQEMEIFLPVLLAGIFSCLLVDKLLNGLLLGEDYARSMGLNYHSVRLVIISLTALLVGCVTAYCGPVGFIGIAVPHLARVVAGTSDHRSLLGVTALLGSVVALVADIIAQLPGHASVLPLNAVTAMIGSPVIIWFIIKRQRKIFV